LKLTKTKPKSQAVDASFAMAAVAPSLHSTVPSPFASNQTQQKESIIGSSDVDFTGYVSVETSDIWRRKLVETMKEKARREKRSKKK
jgi:hypothetical protein